MSSFFSFALFLSVLIVPPKTHAFVPMKLFEVISLSVTSLTHSEMTENAFFISTAKLFNSHRGGVAPLLPEDTAKSAERMFNDYYSKRVSTIPYLLAMADVVKAVASVDTREDTKNDPTWHFDAEMFHLGNAGLKRLWREIVSAVQTGNHKQARVLAGQYLHPMQDFYSHSNWIEMGKTEPNEALGVEGAFLGVVPDIDTPTCSDCESSVLEPFTCRNNILPEINAGKFLTSGYYGGETIGFDTVEIAKPAGKCSHGGERDTTRDLPARGGINKDQTNSLFSPHHYLHRQASALAQAASVKFFDRIRLTVGDEKFANFLNVQLLAERGQPIRPHNTTINSLLNVLDGKSAKRTLKFKVDSLLDSIDVFVHHPNMAPQLTVLSIRQPNGALYLPSRARLNQTSSGLSYQIPTPATGIWSVTVDSDSAEWALEVSGTGTLDILCHFEYFHTDNSRYIGPEQIENNPIFEDNLLVVVQSTCEKCQLKTAAFLRVDGTVLHSFQLQAVPSDPNVYRTNITIPQQAFYIEITGFDSQGHPFQRLHQSRITPTQIRFNFTSGDSTVSQVPPGYQRNITLTVKNEGAAGVLDLSVNDTLNVVNDFQPKSFRLGSGETQKIFIQVAVPKTAKAGNFSDVVFTAALRGSNGTNFNFFKKSVSIAPERPVFRQPVCRVVSSNYQSICAARTDSPNCNRSTWQAEVVFANYGSGLDGIFVSGTRVERISWTGMSPIEDKTNKNVTETTVKASGTCCSGTVYFQMVDKVGRLGQCVLQPPIASPTVPPTSRSVFGRLTDFLGSKFKL